MKFSSKLILLVVLCSILVSRIQINTVKTLVENLEATQEDAKLLGNDYGNWTLAWEYKADYEIKKVCISSDGNYIVAVGENSEGGFGGNDILHLLTGSSELLWKKSGETLSNAGWSNEINDVSVSQNATYLLVGLGICTCLLQRDGSVLQKWGGGADHVSISDDGRYVVIGGSSWRRGIGFFNKSGQELWNFTTVGYHADVSISQTGQFVAAGDDKGYVYLFDRDGNLLWDKKVHDSPIEATYVSISLNGEYIGVGTRVWDSWYEGNGEIAILDKNGEWLLNPIEVQHIVLGISITSNGDFLFIPAASKGVCIYYKNGELVSSFKAREKVLDVDNTPEGAHVVMGSDDLRVYLLENEVIPEFPSFLILPLFMIATLLAVIVYRRKHQTRNKKREV